MSIISINAADAKEEFSELINRVAHNKERIIVTRRGKGVAAIVSLEDLYRLEESQNKHDLQDAVEALQEARQIGSITIEEFKAEIG